MNNQMTKGRYARPWNGQLTFHTVKRNAVIRGIRLGRMIDRVCFPRISFVVQPVGSV